MANALRYSYLRGPGGRFRNPYDHGCKKNCSDFLINGYNEDVDYNEDSPHSEGIGMMHMSRNSNLQNGDAHSHHMNGNGHVAINVNSENKIPQGHVHSSHCSHNHQGKPRTDSAPLGLGGLGLGKSSARTVEASWWCDTSWNWYVLYHKRIWYTICNLIDCCSFLPPKGVQFLYKFGLLNICSGC